MGTADYGQPTDPLSTPSLSQWAEAVHLDTQATDSEQAAQDARLDVLEAERSLGDLTDVNVTDLPPADGDRLAWSDALGQWQPQPSPVTVLGDLTDVILTHARPTDHLIFDGTVWRNRPAGVLGEAVWHVSADTALTDRLPDLTGRGRDALFGADDAAPRVLPWDGETYVHFPQVPPDGVPFGLLLPDQGRPPPTSFTVTVDATLAQPPTTLYDTMMIVGRVFRLLYYQDGRVLTSMWDGATWASGPAAAAGSITWGQRTTWTFTASDGIQELRRDGEVVASGTYPATFGLPNYYYVMTSNGTSSNAGSGDLYRVVYTPDGVDEVVMDPADVAADYATIQNTGAAGGDWIIYRPDSGFKAAVVDRPLLLFGGGQTLTSPAIPEGAGTLIHSVRQWPEGPTDLITVHDGAPVVLDGTYEHLGSALFARTLTDPEIDDVSAALGRPPTAARHAPLLEGSIPAALPPAQPGSIAVLEDNTIAVRTRTGGWVQLAASPLPGGSP